MEKLYTPSALQRFLTELGAAPNKRMSQNFLIDGNIVRKIVQAGDLKPGDQVLEIGPGPGVLTEALLEAGVNVVAVEKDPLFARALPRLDPTHEKLRVVLKDVREVDFKTLFPINSSVKVISNLPYHLTTPILESLFQSFPLFSTIVVMVQEEVARRMTSELGSSDYSSLSIFLRFYSSPEYMFKVSSSCFYPKPKVESAVVKLNCRSMLPEVDKEHFFKIVRGTFQHRRKMMRSSLREVISEEKIKAAELQGFDLTKRPEDLSFDEFVRLANI